MTPTIGSFIVLYRPDQRSTDITTTVVQTIEAAFKTVDDGQEGEYTIARVINSAVKERTVVTVFATRRRKPAAVKPAKDAKKGGAK